MGNTCSVEINLEINYVVWIDPEIRKDEITQYASELEENQILKVKLFKIINDAIDYLKTIKFKETKVIVNGGLYTEFVKTLKKNLEFLYVVPKIIVYTSDPEKFIETNNEYKNQNNAFYRYGGVANTFKKLKHFIKNERDDILEMENKPKKIKEKVTFQWIFEHIDCKEKLMLPLLFQSLIDSASNENMKKYNDILFEVYSNENDELKTLLYSILSVPNIPLEILSKYYVRIFTVSSNFQRDLYKLINLGKYKGILPFVKALYEGLKLRSLPLCTEELLYMGCVLPEKDIIALKESYHKRIKHLPGSIAFCESFVTFHKNRLDAEKDLADGNKTFNYCKVFFILEKEENLSYGLSTHCDIEKLSYFENQKDVLFFPFSAFEVKHINKVYMSQEKVYEIKLLYLDKYLGFIENDKNLITIGEKIPDSEFKNKIINFGLLNKEKLEKANSSSLYNAYKEYDDKLKNKNHHFKDDSEEDSDSEIKFEEEKSNNKEENNKTKEEIIIKENNKTNEEILSKENNKTKEEIINKESNNIKEDINTKVGFNTKEDEIKEASNNFEIESINEAEINENLGYVIIGPEDINKEIQIINSFENVKRMERAELKQDDLQFLNEKEIKENIQLKLNDSNINFTYTYKFDNPGTYKIEYLINSKKLTRINHLFYGCSRLSKLYLPNLDTNNIVNINGIFGCCTNLKILNVSNFDTQNVVDMRIVFKDCSSLENLNISNFITKNVTNMTGMFLNCKSLTSLDLSNFNTQNVTNMSQMFFGCSSLINLDLTNFNTQNVINMIGMFNGCSNLKNLFLTNFNTQNVVNMYCMFCGCEKLKSLDLSTFKTQSVTNMYCMFLNCKSLKNLDISNFNSVNVTYMNWMFNGCDSLKKSNIISKDQKILKFFESQRVKIFNKNH